MNKHLQAFEKNKKELYISLAATFLWGLLAHGYCFLHSNFSHDSLNEFNSAIFGDAWKIQLGRYFIPVYRSLFHPELTYPWLIGVLSLLWCGLAVYLVTRIFRIENKGLIVLTAGIFTVNLTFSATAATFIHDLDCDMLALLFSVAAVYCWKAHPWGWLAGAVLVMLSLAIYQSYITVTIVLIMFICILDLLDGISFREVFCKGLKAVGMLLLGGIAYYITMKAAMRITNISMLTGKYNTVDKPLEMLSWSGWLFQYMIKTTYLTWYDKLVHVISPYPTLSVLSSKALLAFICGCFFLGLLSRKVRILEKLLCAVLILLLPFAMNLMYFLTIEQSHELMRFALWLTYLLALLLGRWLAGYLTQWKCRFVPVKLEKIAHLPLMAAALLVTVLIYGGVQTANAMYLKKDLEHDAYLSLMTRIVYRIEAVDEYIPGETPLVMVGLPEQIEEVAPGFETYRDPNGMYYSDVLLYSVRERWQRYFDFVLMNPAVFANETVWNNLLQDPQVAAMPAYPEPGCIAMMDDVMVVKLGQ